MGLLILTAIFTVGFALKSNPEPRRPEVLVKKERVLCEELRDINARFRHLETRPLPKRCN